MSESNQIKSAVEAFIINTGSNFHYLLCGLMCGRLVNETETETKHVVKYCIRSDERCWLHKSGRPSCTINKFHFLLFLGHVDVTAAAVLKLEAVFTA